MKINQFLVSLLWIFLLFYFFKTAQQIQISPSNQDHPKNLSLSIKFQRPLRNGRFSFPMGFGKDNKTIPVLVTMDTNGLWVNNDSASPFDCSKTCHTIEEHLERSWNTMKDGSTASVTKVTDKVSFGGLTYSYFELFIVNQVDSQRFKDSSSNRLGLSFRDSSLHVLEELKLNGVIKKSLFSISLKNNNEGELILGGHPPQKTESDFQFTPLVGEQSGRPKLEVKGFSFGSSISRDKNSSQALLDWESPFLTLPKEYVDMINEEIDSKGLRLKSSLRAGIPVVNGPDGKELVSCEALSALEDLMIQLEDFTLYIPPSAYIRYDKGFNNEEEVSENGCFLSVIHDPEISPKIILGQPLFKAYDIVFDSEKKTIGFSVKSPSNKQRQSKLSLLVRVALGLAGLGVLSYLFVKKSRTSYLPLSGNRNNYFSC